MGNNAKVPDILHHINLNGKSRQSTRKLISFPIFYSIEVLLLLLKLTR